MMGFAMHQRELATGTACPPVLNLPPASLPAPSCRVVPGQHWRGCPASRTQLALPADSTCGSGPLSVASSQIIPPSSAPRAQRLFSPPVSPLLPCTQSWHRHLSQSLCEHQRTVLGLHRSKSFLSCALLRSTALPTASGRQVSSREGNPKRSLTLLSPSPNLLPVSALSLFWMFPVKRIIQGRFLYQPHILRGE